MNLKRTPRFIILLALLFLPTVAQAQPPTPSPSPARSLSENIAALTQRAASLLPQFDNEVVSKLIGWFELLAWVLGNCLAGFAMLRIMREDNGEGSNLYWWFGRLGLFFVLSGTSLAIINGMSAIGYEIANGNESRQRSVLQQMYLAQRDSFNESYAKFQQNMFTVKVDGRETAIEPVQLNSESVLGILVDSESTLKDFDRKADVSQWNISTMMTWLNFERALIEFGDLILVILGAALLLGMKLAMPFMIAGIVDRHLASKTTYPFFYGVVALTLVWPCVSKIIRIIAYMWGNVAMAVGDGSPLYIWNYQTMRAIGDPLAQPQYTIALAAFGMALGALCLYGTPFISMYFLSGRIYESVATVVSSWTGAMIGTGIEKYSAELIAAGANFQKAQVGSEVGRSIRETDIGASREVSNIISGAQRDLSMTRGNASVGRIEQAMNVTESMIPSDAPILRGLVTWPKVEAVNARENVATNATTQYSRDMVQNQETIAKRVIHSSQQYQSEMNQAIDRQAGAQIAGVNAGAGQAIGGYQRGATQARSGVDQNYQLELGANKQIYASQVDAAGQIRGAGLEAAKLRQAASVIAAVGREISREVGQGMRMRF